MSPFTTPDSIFISRHPQDMRAGIQTLAAKVVTDFGENPQDGALYCFVSRDCAKVKMLRFDVNGWCLYYCRLAEGIFHWQHSLGLENPKLKIDRVSLYLLLDGLDTLAIKLPTPPTANNIL